MKSSIVLALVLVGSTAMACPNLTGKYLCPNEDGGMDHVAIGQTETDGVTTYNIVTPIEGGADDRMELIADGQVRKTEAVENGLKAVVQTTYTCVGEKLNWKENTVFSLVEGNVEVVVVDTLMDLGKSSTGDLNIVGQVTIKNPEGESTEALKQTCKLQ